MQHVSAAKDETMGELVTVTTAEVPKANFSSEPDPSKVVGRAGSNVKGTVLSRSIAPFRFFRSRKPVLLEQPVGQFSNYTGPESEVSATLPMVEPSLTTQRRRPEGLVLRAG
jgi:hypothetical protein